MSTTDDLAHWLEREAALIAKLQQGRGPGVVSLQDIQGLNGLQTMHGVMDGNLPYATIAKTLDYLLVSVEDGMAVFQGTPGPTLLNPMGGIHGGWYATLLDSAMACAVHTKMPVARSYTTAELSINIVKGIRPGVQRVRAIGEVVHCGKQLATAHGRLVGPDGTLYAHGTTTCLVFDLPSPKDNP
jgi:uncharacterized protein (TIGR00369 family)